MFFCRKHPLKGISRFQSEIDFPLISFNFQKIPPSRRNLAVGPGRVLWLLQLPGIEENLSLPHTPLNILLEPNKLTESKKKTRILGQNRLLGGFGLFEPPPTPTHTIKNLRGLLGTVQFLLMYFSIFIIPEMALVK